MAVPMDLMTCLWAHSPWAWTRALPTWLCVAALPTHVSFYATAVAQLSLDVQVSRFQNHVFGFVLHSRGTSKCADEGHSH
jgi:hypothetical protein